MPSSSTDRTYPWPDDFHVFFVACNYTAVEPATLSLVGLSVATAVLARRKHNRQ